MSCQPPDMMEAFLGKWKLDTDANEGTDEFMAVAGVPDEMKEKIAEMEQTCLLREVPDEPEKFFMKYECGEVRVNKFVNSDGQ